ncbi:interferon-inducible GTPase-domain-containing protein [Tricharina praecox]|uniref:interferon-inducible GTPase-domain-containing protein n=1 Tax=Tricharina praecox TaxID=43433 RepID=UPI00222000AC|nr:interferon-inducible GTPase-domain-containing protein [Tricharina praecox]KAI5845324.1 interferon-inducible GTPase-domain-containing protein [Tricharina praecox]
MGNVASSAGDLREHMYVEDTKIKLQYRTDRFHFVICVAAGSGKSSLINAFRGIKAKSPGTAPVGIVETTSEVTRYSDRRPGMPYELFVWYDIPGAGTAGVPQGKYFITQGLFIFDFIILVYDTRFTEIDAEILANCREFDVPVFIVRSKANQHIRNMLDTDEDLTPTEAREQYIVETRQNIEANLSGLNLYDEKSRCYIVSSNIMYSMIKGFETAVDGANCHQGKMRRIT